MDNNSELSVDPTPSEIEKNVILKSKSEQKLLSKESLDYAERIPNQVEKKIIDQITKRFGKHYEEEMKTFSRILKQHKEDYINKMQDQ